MTDFKISNDLIVLGSQKFGLAPASAGTLRFQYSDDIRFRNANNDGDLIVLAFGESNIMELGGADIERIDIARDVIVSGEFQVDHAGSALSIRNTSSSRAFDVSTSGTEQVTVGFNLDRSAAVVDRFRLLGSNLSVDSTVGFSHAVLLEGQARTAGSVNHDASWRMYVEPLTTTAFDGQSVFKITAEIDTGGPTTVFTLSDTGDLTVPGALAVSGAGPHAIAGTPSGIIGLLISETFTSDGSATLASGVFITQTLVGASGDTTSLTGTTFVSAITTQTETESIANISQVEMNEPFITDNLTGNITNAQTLLIVGEPTEGVSNFALRVASGLSQFGGTAQAATATGPAFLNEASSATNPTLIPDRSELTTGIGGISNGLNIIALGVNAIQVLSSAITLNLGTTINNDLFINTSLDEIPFRVRGHSTQTNPLVRYEQNDQTIVMTLSNAGSLALPLSGGGIVIGGALDHDGTTVGFFGTSPATQPADYTRNATIVEDRTLLASASATIINNNNVLAALIADLQSLGILGTP